MRALALALSLPCVLLAQPRGPEKRLARMEAQGENGPLARQIMGVRIKQMREVMGLPESQAAAIADRWAQHDREIIQNVRQLNQLRGQFREILLGPGAEEEKSARLKPLLEQFLDLRRKQVDLRGRFETDLRSGLSPAQQARLIMMVEEFTKRLQEGLANRPGQLRRQQNQ
jgi:hypothetical protein